MTGDDFVQSYYAIARRALAFSEKSRREGLLALEEDVDQEKIGSRDIFEYGIRFVIDGMDPALIEKILSNILRQEKDEEARVLKTIQKEAVLMIQQGMNPRLLSALLNSYTGIPVGEDELNEALWD